MENIVTAVESAIHVAETEAKKIETEVKGDVAKVETACAHIYACIKCHLTGAEAAKPVVTQALNDAQEDAEAIEGAAARIARKFWSAI